MKGVHNGFGTHFSVLGDHFSPILALLGPVYRVFPHAVTLLVVQGVLLAASVPSVWLFTRRKLGRWPAYLVAVAYALSWGLQAAMAADFHEIAFAVPLLAIAIERLDAGRLRSALVAAGLLLLVKEDFGLVVALFGLVIGIREKKWRTAAVVAVVGIAVTVLANRVFIPLAGGRSSYYWDYYAALGSDPAAALWHVIRHPVSTWKYAFAPHAKITLLRWLFAPYGFLSFGSSFVLLALPLIAERLLSSNVEHWTLTHQYSAPLVPILTLAAVDTVGKVVGVLAPSVSMERAPGRHERQSPSRRSRRPAGPSGPATVVGTAYAVGLLVVALWACSRMPFDQLLHPADYRLTAYQKVQAAAVASVPDGATVEASDYLAPQLVDRAAVMLLDATPHNAPWVVFDEGHVEFPFTSAAQEQQRVNWLRAHGYRQVFSRDDLVVYHRDGS
jgi:hypothetical protein